MSTPAIDTNLTVHPLSTDSGSGTAVASPLAPASAVQAPANATGAQSDADDEPSQDSAKQLEQALNERISRLLSTDIRLQIDRDHDTGHFVYKSINSKTGELHRQFPAAQILRMLAFFKELDGLLYDKEV